MPGIDFLTAYPAVRIRDAGPSVTMEDGSKLALTQVFRNAVEISFHERVKMLEIEIRRPWAPVTVLLTICSSTVFRP